MAAIKSGETKRAELIGGRLAGAAGNVTTVLLRAADLYRAQLEAGKRGDPKSVSKARPIIRELIGEVRVQPYEDGSLWAHFDFQPAALLRVGTNGRGEAISRVNADSWRILIRPLER